MRILLDTHIFMWALSDSKRLSRRAKGLIMDADVVSISAATIWEAAIKIGLGKLKGDSSDLVAAIATSGFRELSVSANHAAAIRTLPPIHRDPFDRLLIAQAISESLNLVTSDATLARYTDLVILA